MSSALQTRVTTGTLTCMTRTSVVARAGLAGVVATAALAVGGPVFAYPPGKSPIVATAPKTCAVKKACKFVLKQVKPGTVVTVTVGNVKATGKANAAGVVTVTIVAKAKAKSAAWSTSKVEGKAFKGKLAVK